MIYTGDILIAKNSDGDFDINFQNGQPDMTDGFETMVLLAVFGDKTTWQNLITQNKNEKYISDFPEIIARATVSEKTKNDGIQALKNAMNFMIEEKIAKSISVTGLIINAYAIGWGIEIYRPTTGQTKYEINWDKGVVSVSGGE